MLTKLTYHIIRSRDKNTYMASLYSTESMDLYTGVHTRYKLPTQIYDELCSVSFKGYTARDIDARHNILICLIYQAIVNHWDLSIGVPIVKIKGQTGLFDKHFVGTNILPYFIRENTTVEVVDQYKIWSDILAYVPNITLLYSTSIYDYTIVQNANQMIQYMKLILKQHL